MKIAFRSFLSLLSCATLLLSAISANAEDKKADPTGTWTWSMQGRGGQGGNEGAQAREITLKISKEGDKYAGTMSGARGGETKLDDVKVEGDQVSFKVTREFQGNSFTTKYSGKVAVDTITGKIEMERQGQTRSRDWVAKRKTEEKK
jgi:hypothetical protein